MHVSQFIQNKTAAIVESQPARNKKKKKKKTVSKLNLLVTTGMKHNKIQQSIKEITFLKIIKFHIPEIYDAQK